MLVAPRPEATYLGSAAYRESFSPFLGSSNITGAGSGIMSMVGIPLYAGDVVTSLSFMSGATALTQGSNNDGHWWFALYNPAAATMLAQTADQTTAAWAANTIKTLALSSPQTIAATGLHYAAVMVSPGTGGAPAAPTYRGVLLNSSIVSFSTGWPTGRKTIGAQNGSGLTTTAPAGPLTLSSAYVNAPYALAT